MTYKTHIALALCLNNLWSDSVQLSAEAMMIGTAVAAASAILPDLDCANSFISRRLKHTSTVIRLFTTHRGVLHTPVLWLGVCTLLTSIPALRLYIPSFAIGVFSHLALDAATPGGVPLFWPVTGKRWHMLNIRSGGCCELVLCIALWSYLVLLILSRPSA